MSYDFEFDMIDVSRSFFRKIIEAFSEGGPEKSNDELAEEAVEKLGIPEDVEVPLEGVVELINDITDIHTRNQEQEKDFIESENRALLLPHCSRKFMDERCDASFNREYSTYECESCSDNCLINRAVQLGKKEGYDAFILPGGSCIPKIIEKNNYDGVVAVACPDEVHLCNQALDENDISHQGVSLLKNGCSNTVFNMETLKKILRKG